MSPYRRLARLPWRLVRWVRQGALGVRPPVHALVWRGAVRLRRMGLLERFPQGPRRLASLRDLALPATPRPEVSVVVPVHGRLALTARCLASLAAARASVSFEVIVVDDASADGTATALAGIRGLRVARQERNVGFVGAANRGAGEARGRFLVFLNNDTLVTDGWLDALRTTFEDFSDCGAAGAQLIYPDGRVQEAGAIVWRDGSAWNYGNGRDPASPDLAYARRVDYCSAAALMVEASLFRDSGGFDEAFAPGYYEDVDLAFRLRRAGRHVYYQPAARVYHIEGGTSGTDLSAGIKRFQVVHRDTFLMRWSKEIAAHGAAGEHPEEAKERWAGRRALILNPRMIAPDRDAGSQRLLQLLGVLRGLDFKATFLPANLALRPPYGQRLQARGVEVLHTPYVGSPGGHLRARGGSYDLVLLSRVDAASTWLGSVRRHCPRAVVLFDTVDLHFLRERRRAELEGDGRLMAAAERTRRLELAVAAGCDATLVVSPEERRILLEMAPKLRVQVVSDIQETAPAGPGSAARSGLLFVGGFEHLPNVDGVLWFVSEVLPRIRALLPGVVLYVVGAGPAPAVRALQGESVQVLGHVPDLKPLLERCLLSVAPLRFGSGVKGKINLSLAHGLPCVATSLACEGMALESGRDVLVADTPDGMAWGVVRLHREPELWRRLAEAGRRRVEEVYSPAAARRALAEVLSAVGL